MAHCYTNTKMYIPSDLANQYNEKHSCDKRFRNWLYNKNTIEYLNYLESKVEARILPSTSSRDGKWYIAILILKNNSYITEIINEIYIGTATSNNSSFLSLIT